MGVATGGVQVHPAGLKYQTDLLRLRAFKICCYTHCASKNGQNIPFPGERTLQFSGQGTQPPLQTPFPSVHQIDHAYGPTPAAKIIYYGRAVFFALASCSVNMCDCYV